MKQILCFIIVCLINVGFAFPQSHFTKIWTGNGLDHMNFYALSPTINGEPLQVDDEIAIFDGENCVGFKKITKLSNIVSIITSSDDTKPVGIIEGFRVGNKASIKIWDASLKIEISDIAITVVKGSLIFAPSETVEFTIECIPPAIPMVGIIT